MTVSERYTTVMGEKGHSDTVRDEAERRFARQLSRRGGADERLSLARWLGESPEHARAYEATERLWDELGRLRSDPEVRAMRGEAEATARRSRAEAAAEAASSPRLTLKRWTAMALAAGLAALAVLGVYESRLLDFGPGDATSLATASSERRSETLADGSTVTLNVDTRVEARMQAAAREVVLTEGEALFNVQSDPSRPFVVRVGSEMRVTALGTRFQVRHRSDGAAVTLLEGRVRVDRGGVSRVLEVGEQALFAAAGGIDVQTVDLEEATSWSRGWMVFRGQSLGYVVDEVNRYAEHKIRIADPDLADLELSGNFYLGDSASMVAAMSVVLPLRVERDGEAFVLRRGAVKASASSPARP